MPGVSKVAKIKLEHDLQINGVTIPKGTQEVPAEVADDWQRMDNEATQEELNHHREKFYQDRQ